MPRSLTGTYGRLTNRSASVSQPLTRHVRVAPDDRQALGLLAQGRSNCEIARTVRDTDAAIRALLQGFCDRTGLTLREAIAWTARHLVCCLGGSGPDQPDRLRSLEMGGRTSSDATLCCYCTFGLRTPLSIMVWFL